MTMVSKIQKIVSKAELARIAGVTNQAVTKAIKNGLQAAVVGKRIDINHDSVQQWLKNRNEQRASNGIDPIYHDAIKLCVSRNEFSIAVIRAGFKIGPGRAEKILNMIKAAKMDKVSQSPTPKPMVPIPLPPPKPKPLPQIAPGVENTKNTKKQHSLANHNNSDTEPLVHKIPENIAMFIDMTLREIIERFGTDVAFLDYLKATKEIENITSARLKNATTEGLLVSRELIKINVIDRINATHQKLLTDGAKTINRHVRTMTQSGSDEKETEAIVIDQLASFIKPMKTKITRAVRDA